MVDIFAVGSPTVDSVIPVAENKKLEEIAVSLCQKPGDKQRIKSYEKFEEIREAVSEFIKPDLTFPGGSAPNTLIAMSIMLGDQFSATLFTALGNDKKSQFLRNQFYNYGITLSPGSAGIDENTPELRPAESLVFLWPDGDRRIVNYPGTIAAHMKDVKVRPPLVRKADAVMLFGSVRETFGHDVFDETLKIRWGDHVEPKMHTIPLWFSLPTNGEYSAANRDYFKWIAPSCNIFVGNETEIAAYAGTVGDNLPVNQIAQERRLAGNLLNGGHGIKRESLKHAPMAFMTEGKLGATVVQHDFGRVSVRPVQANAVNSLAAGDVTTGVFYAGISVGMNPAAAAQLAMSAGAITVEFKGTVPPDLAKQLSVRDPDNYKVFADLLAKQRSLREGVVIA